MAYADYKLCDICGEKAFYDSNLNYEWSTKQDPIPENLMYKEVGIPIHMKLDRLGDWAVLCRNCSKTYKCVIEKLPEVNG